MKILKKILIITQTLLLLSCSSGGGEGGNSTSSFTVNYTTPSQGNRNISPNTSITAWFSSDIDPNGFDTKSAITLLHNGELIPGNFVQNGPQLVFTPIDPLEVGKTYTVVIQSGIKGIDGSIMNGDYRWSFEVQDAINDYLRIVSTTPAANASGVELSANVSVSFDKQLNPSKYENSILVQLNNTDVEGVISIDYDRLIFNPINDLTPGVTYRATVRSNLVESISGLGIGDNYIWLFTTTSN